MVTTIKLHDQTKQRLDTLKRADETYDDFIDRLLSTVEQRSLAEQLKDAYTNQPIDEEFKEWDSF